MNEEKEIELDKSKIYHLYSNRMGIFNKEVVSDMFIQYLDTRKKKYLDHEYLFRILKINKNNTFQTSNSKIILFQYELSYLTEIGEIRDYPEYLI